MLKVKSQISRSEILERVTEEQIFRYYLPEFTEVGRKFKSPFVNEKTPSCTIFSSAGRLFFKCFSSGNGGDAFTLVQLKYSLTEYESLVVIANDFNIKTTETIFKQSPIIVKSNTIFYPPKERAKIRVKYKNWTNELLAYWQQYKYIDRGQLDKYDIRPISHYWINGTRFHPKFAFVYSFEWFSPYTYKILQPYESKEWKWISNCPDTLLQGYHQLPKEGNNLFITSSLKDVALLDKLGYNSVAPSAEGVIPKQLAIDDLTNRFNNVIPYMNNDKTGIAANNKYKKQYDLVGILNPSGLPKDPSDLAKEDYDVKEIIEFLINKEEYGI